jgi:methylenetetrahydrofolate dehydrogenase (NAD+)
LTILCKVAETSKTLKEILAISDVVISGVPSEKYKLDTSLLKDGVIAVNFSSRQNFNEDIVKKAAVFVPSIGKITVSMLGAR